MESRERKILSYKTSFGRFPYREWRSSFTDDETEVALDVRVTRLQSGNFGDSEPIGDGASEARIDFGPGYRIYYGVDGDDIVLLCGGKKTTQAADIARAKAYWKDYKERATKWKEQTDQQSNIKKNS